MSICPWILRESPMSLFDQNFGLGLLNEDLLQPLGTMPGLRAGYLRPWRHLAGRQSGTSSVVLDKDGFKVNLDVQQFRPEEVTVKIVDNNLVVEGSHEERDDEHGFISRTFKRRYVLPKEIESEAIASSLSSDGVLTITAPPKKSGAIEENERVIPIVHTKMPAIQNPAPSTYASAVGATAAEVPEK